MINRKEIFFLIRTKPTIYQEMEIHKWVDVLQAKTLKNRLA